MEEEETYLGDGLYASFDGWQVKLRAPRLDGDHVIFIEPMTFAKLMQFTSEKAGWKPAQT